MKNTSFEVFGRTESLSSAKANKRVSSSLFRYCFLAPSETPESVMLPTYNNKSDFSEEFAV